MMIKQSLLLRMSEGKLFSSCFTSLDYKLLVVEGASFRLANNTEVTSHVGISYTRLFIESCRQTNLAGTRASPRNRVANTKIIFVLARLPIAPLASDWPGTFQEFLEGYGGEMSEPSRPFST